MHVQVVNIVTFSRFVWLGGEPDQALFKNIDAERVHPCQQHINPQVKLEIVYQERLIKILLCYLMLFGFNLARVFHQEDALTLRHGLRLYDVDVVSFLEEGLPELVEFCWQHVCLREEIVVFRELFSHLF